MGRSERKAARHYQFWRKVFWTRPALLLFYAVLSTGMGLGFLAATVSQFQDARGMRDAGRCAGIDRAQAQDRDCLLEVQGWLDGPRYSRGPGSDWYFLEPGDRGIGDADEVQVGTVGSRVLGDVQGEPVTGLVWHGDLVGFEVDGRVVESDEYGARSWTWLLFVGLASLGGTLMLVQAASYKRRLAGGWWRMTSEEVGLMVAHTRLMSAATVLVAPSLTATLVFAFGLPLWLVYTVFGVLTVALVPLVLRARRRAAESAAADAPGDDDAVLPDVPG